MGTEEIPIDERLFNLLIRGTDRMHAFVQSEKLINCNIHDFVNKIEKDCHINAWVYNIGIASPVLSEAEVNIIRASARSKGYGVQICNTEVVYANCKILYCKIILYRFLLPEDVDA